MEQAQNTIQGLMLLPTEAKNRFQKAADENQQLELVSKAQNIIIDDLSISIPDLDNIQKNLNDADEELKEVDDQLKQTQDILLELLTNNNNNNSSKKGAGDILKTILTNLQKTLTVICSQAASKGQIEVSLFGLMDLEDQVGKIIDDMSSRGLYPETESDANDRVQRMQAHNLKVVQFLKELQPKKDAEAPQ